MGIIAISTTGVPIFNGFDAGGRDAVANEIQDVCDGHPDISGTYHYHSGSSCILDSSKGETHSDLVAYAIDGFGLYGKYGENGKLLFTKDLDECHGHTHIILWDGKTKEMYHYHSSPDFPYTISCFRGTKSTVSGETVVSGSTNSASNGQTPQAPSAPKEAIDACVYKKEGNSCSFNGARGMVSGTCKTTSDGFACVP